MPAAADYNQDSYSACSFNKDCPRTTIIETPSGLLVAINIVDGQIIPKGTYIIEVTPLNGQGASFSYVEFFIDGTFISKFFPDGTGTATYDWNTQQHPGKLLTFKIYDGKGGNIVREFKVIIANETPPVATTSSPSTISQSPQNTQGLMEQFIRSIPAQIALSIPYLLYAILLVTLIVLLLHSRREAAEARHTQVALKRAKQLTEEKDGFIELVSHYLRTPLTLIRGSAELLASTQPTLAARVQVPIAAFSASVEQLITSIMDNKQLNNIGESSQRPKGFLWLSTGLWIVIAIVGVVAIFFNYLLVNTGVSDSSVLGFFTQGAIFTLLVVSLVVIGRERQLRIRDRVRAETQESQQIAIDEARNNLIRQAAADLTGKLGSISAVLPQLPADKTSQLFQEGCTRAAEVLKRFRATAQVTPPLTTMPFAQFTLQQAVNHIQKYLSEKLESKHLTIITPQQDVYLASQQPSWVIQTISSIIDNAIAYSPDHANIEISVVIEHGTALVHIQDHGKGIPKEKITQLFKPFSRAEAPTQFDHDGIGLSLYLGRLLMTSLGGDIRINSAPHTGTRVTVRFPIAEKASTT